MRRPPNIVFIMLDDLGYGDFGCYGQQKIKTPNVDRLATEGRRFLNCYAGGAVCAPSRSVLMTGLHTGHTPVRANAGTVPLSKEDVTLVQVLKTAGYATGGFGKWGLGDAGSTGIPTRHGFDEFFGYLHQVHAHSYYPDFLWDGEKKFPLGGKYSADIIAERSTDFIRRHKDAPFFLYACYTLPHGKFELPSLTPYENEPWTEGQKTYAAMVTKADSYIGNILSVLRELRLEQNTVVFVTSDNGAQSGAGKGFDFFRSNGVLRGHKGDLYEGGIRVPMIVKWPGVVRPRTLSLEPWAFWDVMPTLAEIADTKVPVQIDGFSVLPLLRGIPQRVHQYLYWEANVTDKQTGRIRPEPVSRAVRKGRWKGICPKPGAAFELYDLDSDSTEARDIAAQHPAIVTELQEYLKVARTKPRPHDNGSMKFVS
jgi:arylsulfatase A-like enzyme